MAATMDGAVEEEDDEAEAVVAAVSVVAASERVDCAPEAKTSDAESGRAEEEADAVAAGSDADVGSGVADGIAALRSGSSTPSVDGRWAGEALEVD